MAGRKLPAQSCFLLLSALCLCFWAAGCTSKTYPKEQVRESVLKILKEEYNIPLAQVVITGKTIHLYLPVERLFTADLEDVKVTYVQILGSPIKNGFVVGLARVLSFPQDIYWEALAQIYHADFFRMLKLNWVKVKTEKKKIEKIQDAISLHPDVQDGIGQMLFAVARVARSTDLTLDFYTAQITDMRSGHEFLLQGYLTDMNRLQMLDISQSEYHKRMIKDTRVNQRALVHYPVRQFFQDLNQKTRDEVQEKYFARLPSADWMNRFYFRDDGGVPLEVSQMTWEVEQVKSFLSPAGGRALVYTEVSVIPRSATTQVPYKEEKYLFEIVIRGKTVQIVRIIPYHLLNELLAGVPELKMSEQMLQENIKTWKSEFEPKELFFQDFLARQMMGRLYEQIYQDERVANTFRDLGFEVRFREKPRREFVFDIRPVLKDEQAALSGEPLLTHEDMVYLEEEFARTAAMTFQSYRFKDFDGMAIELPDEGERMVASPRDLELFYRKKKALQEAFQTDEMPLADVLGQPA